MKKQPQPSKEKILIKKVSEDRNLNLGNKVFKRRGRFYTDSIKYIYSNKQLKKSSVKPNATRVYELDSSFMKLKPVNIIKSNASLIPSKKRMLIEKVMD